MSRVTLGTKEKKIGKVLFIVEGIKTAVNLLRYVFTNIFDYQYEKCDRLDRYTPYNTKNNPTSSVFVINTEESNIKDIKDVNGYLDDMFVKLVNKYHFPVDNATIFYLFDRDFKSNTDINIIKELLFRLYNSRERENDDFDRPGLLLLSYPAIEAFIASNYLTDCFDFEFALGEELKTDLNDKKINYQKINSETLMLAAQEMNKSLEIMNIQDYNIDNMSETNLKIFEFQESNFNKTEKYRLFSCLCFALIDLGLLIIEE